MTKHSTAHDAAAKPPVAKRSATGGAAADESVRTLRRSRSDVVSTALRLLDEGGLAGLSMRNIANALSLQVSALYWHFPNKQSILAAVADEILSTVAPVTIDGATAIPVAAVDADAADSDTVDAATADAATVDAATADADTEDAITPDTDAVSAPSPGATAWREAATAVALGVRDALLATTDGAEVVASTLALGLGERDPATPIARALEPRASGCAPASARTIATYLLGHTQHWQQRRFAERLGLAEVSPVDERREFLEGLDLLLDGVAAGHVR